MFIELLSPPLSRPALTAVCETPPKMPGERRLLPKIFDATAAALLTSVPVFTAVASTSCDRPPASSSPQDFSATTHTGSSSEENAAGAPQGGAILHPTGKHHGWWSLNPIKEAVPWAKRSAKYFADLIEANGGASVFKGHPGLRVTFLTDHASAKWFLSQPESVLDRQVCNTGGEDAFCYTPPLSYSPKMQ